MTDQRRENGNGPITLISSSGERKGQVPVRSGSHAKETLRDGPSGEHPAARDAKTTGEHPVVPREEHQSGPHSAAAAKKKNRPEVEAWAQDLSVNTGEYKLSQLRAARDAQAASPAPVNPFGDAIGMPTSDHGAQAPQAEHAMPSWDDVEAPPDVALGTPVKAAREPMKLPSVGVMITGAAIFAAVTVGGFMAFKVATKEKVAPVVVRSAEEDEFVRRMRAEAEGAPECWTTDVGFDFTYKGPKGEMQRADRIADVPHLYRRSARCVREQ
mgnify:CR=1 FL=1